MIERLKSVGEAAKNVIIFIVTPLAFIAGFIYYLISRSHNLENRLEEARGDEKLQELKGRDEAASRAASDAVDEFLRKRNDYLRERAERLRQGRGGAEGTDGDSDGGTDPGPGAA